MLFRFMLFYFVYAFYQAGDENIIVDTTGHLPHYLNCLSTTSIAETPSSTDGPMLFPNPASRILEIKNTSAVIKTTAVYDMFGKLQLEELNGSSQEMNLDVSRLSDGIYSLKITDSSDRISMKKIIVAK